MKYSVAAEAQKIETRSAVREAAESYEKLPPTKPKFETVAVLVLVVEFDVAPNANDLEEIVEKCRETGFPSLAEFSVLAPSTRSVL